MFALVSQRLRSITAPGLRPGWKDPYHCNTEVQREIGLHVVVRLPATLLISRVRGHPYDVRGIGGVQITTGGSGEELATRSSILGRLPTRLPLVRVAGHFGVEQRHCRRTCRFAQVVEAQAWSLARVHCAPDVADHVTPRLTAFAHRFTEEP
jgi:hypothetical protein